MHNATCSVIICCIIAVCATKCIGNMRLISLLFPPYITAYYLYYSCCQSVEWLADSVAMCMVHDSPVSVHIPVNHVQMAY